jgi:hypothetical protein
MVLVYPFLTEVGMQQDSAGWDLRYIYREPSTSFRLYLLFLLVVCIVASIRLIRIWRAAPPFRLSAEANSPAYLRLLQTSSTSLKQWIGCTFLAWGILTSTSLYDDCNRLLGQKVLGSGAILFVIEDYSAALTLALLVVLFLFLVLWHILNRIQHLPNCQRRG